MTDRPKVITYCNNYDWPEYNQSNLFSHAYTFYIVYEYGIVSTWEKKEIF